jgi:hypothetical protein
MTDKKPKMTSAKTRGAAEDYPAKTTPASQKTTPSYKKTIAENDEKKKPS